MFLVDFAGTYLQNIAECDMIKKTAPDVDTVRHCLHTQFNNPVTFNPVTNSSGFSLSSGIPKR